MRPAARAAARVLTVILSCAGLMCAGTVAVGASEPAADTPAFWMDEVAVVADRIPGAPRESAWATSVLTRDVLDELPGNSLSEALNAVPGITFLERADPGQSPMAVTRGFFGGGETEYILLLIDGVPVNDLSTGLIDWERLPLATVERIEVLRGGGSAAYGDAALGAVVNVVTRARGDAGGTAALALGTNGEQEARLTVRRAAGSHRLQLSGRANRTDGFRAHSRGSGGSLEVRDETRLWGGPAYVGARFQRRRQRDAGPLPLALRLEDRTQANPLYADDRRDRDELQLSAGWRRPYGDTRELSTDLGLRLLAHDQTRTLLLAPGFGDTQFRDEGNTVVWSRTQGRLRRGPLSGVTGVDVEYGSLDSRYYDTSSRSALLDRGQAERLRLGLYGEARCVLAAGLLATAGLRYDRIADDLSAAGSTVSPTFHRWTPRLGLNYAYATDPARAGNVYLNWSRAFKAPTLDQLFDQRKFDAGPARVGVSNTGLQPQSGRSVELGVYQRLALPRTRIFGELTASVYRIDLEDEIDFDLTTYRYGNIQQSRHDGLEASATLHLLPRLTASTTVSLTDVTFRDGPRRGLRLKNIPDTALHSRLSLRPRDWADLTVVHRAIGDSYLDDGNATALSGYQAFDVRLQVRRGDARFHVDVSNLLDERLSSSGFALFDPASGQDVPYFYPGRGRTWRGVLDVAF